MHMTGNKSLLEDIREGAGPTVSFADNSKGRTVGYGKYKIGRIIIEDIAIVEGLQHNLLSVSPRGSVVTPDRNQFFKFAVPNQVWVPKNV